MGLTQKLGTIPLAIFTDASNNVGIGGSPSGSFKLDVTGTGRFTSGITGAACCTGAAASSPPPVNLLVMKPPIPNVTVLTKPMIMFLNDLPVDSCSTSSDILFVFYLMINGYFTSLPLMSINIKS